MLFLKSGGLEQRVCRPSAIPRWRSGSGRQTLGIILLNDLDFMKVKNKGDLDSLALATSLALGLRTADS